MNPLVLGPVLEFGGRLLERLFPDPQEKAKAELQMLALSQEADLKIILAQIEVNAREAQHASIFVAGWRPFTGWTCGAGLAFATIVYPLLSWLARVRGWPAPPTLDTDVLMYVLGGLLGIGGLRSIEKIKGAAK